jgi:hypothetical protein
LNFHTDTGTEQDNVDPIKNMNKRSYNDYVLKACGVEFEEERTKRFALETTEYWNMRPVQLGESDVALTSQSCINSATQSPNNNLTLIPKEETMVPVTSMDNNHRYFNNVLCTSSYKKALSKRNYVEIDDGVIKELNMNWNISQQAKYYSAQCLSGSIIVNVSKQQALLVNTIEIYGRTRTVDAHRERCGVEKDNPIDTSLPSETYT